jgi:hypothetical protein
VNTRIFRVFPWLPDARTRDGPGHPLYVSPTQGAGRIDGPDRYRVLYASTTAVGAIGERFGDLEGWSEAMFVVPSLAGGTRALAEYVLDDPLLDLDDAKALLERELRPSRIVTRDRGTTQRWARAIFDERRWAGISWWSFWNPDWVSCGIWAVDRLELASVAPLADRLEAVHEAREVLARPWRIPR